MKHTPRRAFHQHKANAKLRLIPFEFSFEEWVAWWTANLGPEWLSLRGRRKGQYVMARKKDNGSYNARNVDCLLCEQNSRDGVKVPRIKRVVEDTRISAKSHPKKLTVDIVRHIFVSLGTQNDIATRFKVSARLIRMIKNRKIWYEATKDIILKS